MSRRDNTLLTVFFRLRKKTLAKVADSGGNTAAAVRDTFRECGNPAAAVQDTFRECGNPAAAVRDTFRECGNPVAAVRDTFRECGNLDAAVQDTFAPKNAQPVGIGLIYKWFATIKDVLRAAGTI